MDRRSFLISLSGAALSQTLMGCRASSEATARLNVLQGTIPPQIYAAFQRFLRQQQQQGSLNFTVELQLETLFTHLQQLQQQEKTPSVSPREGLGWLSAMLPASRSRPLPDLVTLGDSWLQAAIQQGLIQPFDVQPLQSWNKLPQNPWHQLVCRDRQGFIDPQGAIWALPFRWGSTILVYRRDIFEQRALAPPSDWHDLWRTELQHQLSLLNSPRDVIGMALKSLGQSYNIPAPQRVSGLATQLAALHRQVKFYSSTAYLQPLVLGDTWLAMGWSSDVLPLIQRNPKLAAVFPKSGTALWADIWVRPAAQTNPLNALTQRWIDFCWAPTIAIQLTLFSRASSPAILTAAPGNLPEALRQNQILLPAETSFRASEFLYPLQPSSHQAYQQLWQEMRQIT